MAEVVIVKRTLDGGTEFNKGIAECFKYGGTVHDESVIIICV